MKNLDKTLWIYIFTSLFLLAIDKILITIGFVDLLTFKNLGQGILTLFLIISLWFNSKTILNWILKESE